MKKLLITTMAAVSVGLCAKAADDGFISGTSFDDLTTGNFSFDNDYWPNPTNQDDEFKIIDVTYPEGVTKQHWDWTDEEKALSIDTANPILRNVNPKDGENGVNEAQNVTTPVFFDSVVQFTATDVEAAPESGDKLRVWLYESSEEVAQENSGEVSSTKKLVVTAAYNDNGTYVTKHYYTDAEIEPDSWHRLTIKSFTNNGFVTFSVWVDETLVSSEGVTEFLSLQYTENKDGTTIQGVAFDGKGAVDDIVFTTTVPEFAEEPGVPTVETYALNIVGENFQCHVYTNATWAGGKVSDLTAINTEYKTLWLGIYPSENYELESIKLGNQTITPPEYDEGDKVYYLDELQISTEDIANGAEFTLTITMKETTGGGSGEDPEDPEVPAKPTIGGDAMDTADAFIAAANSGATIKVPTGWTLDGNTLKDADLKEYATFADYYTVKLADGTVTLELNDKAKPEIDETSADKGDAIVVTDAAVALGVTNAKTGLWYGAQAYSDAACTTKIGDEPTGWEKADGETVTVTATKPEADKAFFKVVVTDIAPKSTEE